MTTVKLDATLENLQKALSTAAGAAGYPEKPMFRIDLAAGEAAPSLIRSMVCAEPDMTGMGR